MKIRSEHLVFAAAALFIAGLLVAIALIISPSISIYNTAKETVDFVSWSQVEAFKKGHTLGMSDETRQHIQELKEIATSIETRISTIIIPTFSMIVVTIFSVLTFWLQLKTDRRDRRRSYLDNFDRLAPLSKSTACVAGNLTAWVEHPDDTAFISVIQQSKVALFEDTMSLGFLLSDEERRKIAEVFFTVEDVLDYTQFDIKQKEAAFPKLKKKIDSIQDTSRIVFSEYLDIDKQPL